MSSSKEVAQERPRSARSETRHSLQRPHAPRDAAALPLMVRAVMLAIGVGLFFFLLSGTSLRTPEQKGYALYSQTEYSKAAETFADSYWRAIALYRDGKFKEAAGIFAGFDTAEGAFNHGNALLFQGNYNEAAERYARALELRPGWEDATINREIALARAAALDFEGANMTDGKIGADDFVINNNPSQNQSDNDQTETIESSQMSDAELRAVWLRQVQTDPADFLRSKFSYQLQQQGGAQ